MRINNNDYCKHFVFVCFSTKLSDFVPYSIKMYNAANSNNKFKFLKTNLLFMNLKHS